jgi:hypothetical protein
MAEADLATDGGHDTILQELCFVLAKYWGVALCTKHVLHQASLLIMILSMNTIIRFLFVHLLFHDTGSPSKVLGTYCILRQGTQKPPNLIRRRQVNVKE